MAQHGEMPLYLQIAESIRRAIADGSLKPGDRLPAVREMADRWGCTPGTVSRAYAELAREGLVSGHRGGGTRVVSSLLHPEQSFWRWANLVNLAEQFLLKAVGLGYADEHVEAAFHVALARWRELNREQRSGDLPPERRADLLRFAGSHDLLVEQLVGEVRGRVPEVGLEVEYIGSLGGLIALSRGEADLAGIHLWDEQTDSYNLPFVRRVLPGKRVLLVTLAHRRLGLIVAAGNPHRIHGLEDLTRPGVRFVNRQPGSGCRVWLDAQLRRAGIEPSSVLGYDREERTHLGVAQAVAEGQADVGIGIQAAALVYQLEFVPLTLERYDLVIPARVVDHQAVRAMIEIIRSVEFRRVIETLGGYDSKETGELRRLP